MDCNAQIREALRDENCRLKDLFREECLDNTSKDLLWEIVNDLVKRKHTNHLRATDIPDERFRRLSQAIKSSDMRAVRTDPPKFNK